MDDCSTISTGNDRQVAHRIFPYQAREVGTMRGSVNGHTGPSLVDTQNADSVLVFDKKSG
jgi:hypothetical protein